MRNALQVLTEAIKLETDGSSYISNFSFVYAGVEIQYYGHYYGYAFHIGQSDEFEFAGNNFESMLDCLIPLTDKTIKQMLSELKDFDLAISIETINTSR